MGYDIRWVVLGDEALRRDEIEDLQAHVKVWATWIVGYDLVVSTAPRDRIQAYFSLRPERRADAERIHGAAIGGYAPDVVDDVFDAMRELRDIVQRHEVVIQDDFMTYRWNGRTFKESKDEVPRPAWVDPSSVALAALEPAQLADKFADRPVGERPARTRKQRKPRMTDERFVEEERVVEAAEEARAIETNAQAEAPCAESAPDRDQAIGELVDIVLAERAALSAGECIRHGISNPDPPSTWALRDSIGKVLAERWAEPAALYLLAGADRFGQSYALGDVATAVFERARELAAIRGPAAAAWWRNLEKPEKASHALGFFRALSPVLLGEATEILRAPLPSLDPDIASVALETVAAARSEDALAILVACIRRDRHHPSWTRWRERALDALERARDPRGAPTALLELADGGVRSSGAVRLVASERERGISLLERLRNCTGFLEPSIEHLEYACDTDAATCARGALLDHPFWKARLYALRLAPYSQREAEAPAVWTTFEGADAELTDADYERYVGDLGGFDRERFLAVSRAKGFDRELAPLPTAVEGLASRCADHRSWALSYVDRRRRADDAAALVLADELDLALASRGHQRTLVMWSRWDLPADAAGRGTWARERTGGLPAPLRAVAERGAEAVAADYPSGRFTLSADEREHFARIEQDIATRGDELLARP